MGASAEKRKAKKKAAAEYYKEFSKLNKVEEVGRASTKNKRVLDDSLGDSASAETKNITRKIDRMGREINKDDEYKQNVKSYNDRYAILKDQMANKSSSRYTISDAPAVEEKRNAFGLGGAIGNGGLINQANKQSGPSSYTTLVKDKPKGEYSSAQKGNQALFQSKEEEMAAAQQRMEEYNNGLKEKFLNAPPEKNQFGGIALPQVKTPQAAEQYAQQNKVTDPNKFSQENKFQGFDVLYRDLSRAERAMDDVNTLGQRVINTKTNKLLPEYQKLNDRLKGLIKRDMNNKQVQQSGQSMVSGEIASATPYTETIR